MSDEDEDYTDPWEETEEQKHWWDALEARTQDGRFVLSETPIEKLRNMHNKQTRDAKPKGLWYSCGAHWVEWLRSDWKSRGESYAYVYELELNQRILYLQTEEEILAFTRQYATVEDYEGKIVEWDEASYGRIWNINWPAVARKYAGIEICPYQWGLRMSLMWYYGWDVASGCVWNPRVGVRSLKLIARAENIWRGLEGLR